MRQLTRSTPRLHGWRHPTVLGVAVLAVTAGYGQFSVTASLRDAAAAFGEATGGATIAEQVGLSATTVGIGLAIIRLASLGALPLSGAADHLGRRRMLVGCAAVGLALTVTAALSPSYWWFVAIFAAARPLFSTTNAVGGVVASEETSSLDRTKAVALTLAGYGVGAGLVSVLRVPITESLRIGFRGPFALAAIPLLALPLIARLLREPDRFVQLHADPPASARSRRLGAVRPDLRARLALLATLTFALSLVTGPIITFLFFYAEGILGVHPSSMAMAVLVAGPVGLAGLLAGRWAADTLGRRATAAITQIGVALAGVAAYSGTAVALMLGYWLAIGSSSAYGPAFGALSAEVFPTSNRATAAGWLTAAGVLGAVVGLVLFGAIGDLTNSFTTAAAVIGVLCALAALGFVLLPETRGLELEQSAPELDDGAGAALGDPS